MSLFLGRIANIIYSHLTDRASGEVMLSLISGSVSLNETHPPLVVPVLSLIYCVAEGRLLVF